MHAMIEKTSDTGFSAPLFVQEMASYLLDTRIKEQLRVVNAGYREKAVAVKAGIERSLGPYLQEQRGGSAGFYFYLTFQRCGDASGIAVLPLPDAHDGRAGGGWAEAEPVAAGDLYSGRVLRASAGDLAEAGKRQLRISYGFEDAPQILKALELMREGVEFVHGNAKLAETAR